MAEWHTVESARDEWVGAPLDDDVLTELLGIAREQVIVYASTLYDDEGTELDPRDESTAIPQSWRRAQLMQARNVWNAGKVDPASGGMGEGDYLLRPHPLDWHVKQLLRPRKGVPVVR